MSPTTASRITGLSIRLVTGERTVRAMAYDGDGPAAGLIVEGWGGTANQALHALVANNYRRVCELVGEAQGWRCSNCGRYCGRGRLEFDHITPRSKGREDTVANLRGLCAAFSGGCDTHRRKHGG